MEYQFTGEEHRFTVRQHGNSKQGEIPYVRTQNSTIKCLKEAVCKSQPRMAIDKVAGEQGGMMGRHSAVSWPRDVKQAYNFKCNSKSGSTVSGTDPYLALVMQCKEEVKDKKTAYIRKVICAPKPIVILSTEEQLVRFCTNGLNLSVFSIDPTFDLGAFSVTTTTYEHLNLINRRSGVNPVMIDPLLIHQKKERVTYNIFTDYLLNSRHQLRNLQVLGTDGEVALSSPFLERCPQLIHLHCFNHFKNNIVNHLKSVGVDKNNRRCIVAVWSTRRCKI